MHTPRVEVRVQRDWLTQSYDVYWSVFDQANVTLAAGHDTYGPLWEAAQVEQMVSANTAMLMRTWLREPGT